MKFIKLSSEEVNLSDFIKFWEKLYKDKNKDLYLKNIEKKEFTKDDVRKLFIWKNGGKLSKNKELKDVDELTDTINKLKSSSVSKDDERNIMKSDRLFKTTATIWRIFTLHIIAPQDYPIFDQHVYRAFRFITEGKIIKEIHKDIDKEKFYFEQYRSFFKDLVSKSKVEDSRIIDKALWAFGKFLKNNAETVKS